jgi:orotidine-5'-phosphate decarboxylase
MTFFEKLDTSVRTNNSLLCLGLDTDIHKIPKHLVEESDDYIFEFNKAIIDATYDLVCAYKPNSAYYEADGIEGLASLEKTIEYIHSTYPDIPVILDAKRADIPTTSEHYAMASFDYFKADALTLHPYMGEDSLEPFLKRQDKGCIILCRTSNPSAVDFQDLKVDGKSLFILIAEKVVTWDKKFHNCLMVVGATWPEQMQEVRALAPEMNFLVPGIGKQGGDLEGIMKVGLREDKAGLIINSGRSIIYASSSEDFAEKARLGAQKLRDEINNYR